MKNWTMMMVVVLMNMGVAQADSIKPGLGFDRVGLTASNAPSAAGNTQLKDAPGEGVDQNTITHQARKREMARRLVWLMLSAR